MDWRSNLYSVFIRNLSTSVSNKFMWEFFSTYGRVMDVFVQRRTPNRLTYAFVRYREKFELLNAINMADQRCIDGETIRVVEADSRQVRRKTGEESVAFNNHHMNVFNSQRATWVERDCRPHLEEAVGIATKFQTDNHIGKAHSNHLDIPSLHVDTKCTAETEQWVERTAVGRLKSFIHPTILHETLSLEGVDVNVSTYGGLKVVLTFKSKEVMSSSLCKHVRVFEAWFVYVKPWDSNSLCDESLMWFSMEGVPLRLWNSDFFTKVGNHWGNFIATDDSTTRKVRLDVARVLVAVDRNRRPPPFFRVHAEGSVFVLKIHTAPAIDIVSFPSDHQVTSKEDHKTVVVDDASKPEAAVVEARSKKGTTFSGIPKKVVKFHDEASVILIGRSEASCENRGELSFAEHVGGVQSGERIKKVVKEILLLEYGQASPEKVEKPTMDIVVWEARPSYNGRCDFYEGLNEELGFRSPNKQSPSNEISGSDSLAVDFSNYDMEVLPNCEDYREKPSRKERKTKGKNKNKGKKGVPGAKRMSNIAWKEFISDMDSNNVAVEDIVEKTFEVATLLGIGFEQRKEDVVKQLVQMAIQVR